jgi:hypothetical protein
MMKKLAQAGEGRRCTTPPHFTLCTIKYKVAVYAPAERAEIVGMPKTAETQRTTGTPSAAGARTIAETPASSRKARMGRKGRQQQKRQ